MNTESKIRNCPLCKEEIKADAVKCKHCGSPVAPEKAPHKGTCPYCKEKIQPEAVKCKHCKSSLLDHSQTAYQFVGETDPMSLLMRKQQQQGNVGLKNCYESCFVNLGPNHPNFGRCTDFCTCVFYDNKSVWSCLFDMIGSNRGNLRGN